MKRLWFITIILLTTALSGCSSQRHQLFFNEEEIALWLENNTVKAIEIFSIYNGGADRFNPDEDLWLQEGNKTFAPYENERFDSIADMKAYTESIYTEKYAEQAFYHYFDESSVEASLPLYKELDGKLYVNVNNGGKGWVIPEWLTETMVVKSQTDTEVQLEMDMLYNGEPAGSHVMVLKKMEEKWFLGSPIFGD